MLSAYSDDEDAKPGSRGTRSKGREGERGSEREREQRAKLKGKFASLTSLDLGPDPDWPVGSLPPKNTSLIQGERTQGANVARRRKSLDLTQWPGSTLGGSLRHQWGSLIQRERTRGTNETRVLKSQDLAPRPDSTWGKSGAQASFIQRERGHCKCEARFDLEEVWDAGGFSVKKRERTLQAFFLLFFHLPFFFLDYMYDFPVHQKRFRYQNPFFVFKL
jgi:hypothetical protein